MDQRFSIRARLLTAFLGVVFLSLSGIVVMLLLANTRAAQQENERQLMTVASYKGKAIEEWTNALQSELGNVLVGENMVANIQIVVTPSTPVLAPTIEESAAASSAAGRRALVNAARERLRFRLLNLVSQSRYYTEIFILKTDGRVAVSTIKSRDGQDFSQADFFHAGQSAPYISAPTYSTALSRTLLYAAYPIYGEGRKLVGVLVGRAKTSPLETIFVDPTGFREPGQTYLASPDGVVIAGSVLDWGGRTVEGLNQVFKNGGTPTGTPLVRSYSNLNDERVTAAYLELPSLRGVLVIEQTTRTLQRSQLATLMVNLSMVLASVLLAIYISLLAIRSISMPVTGLAEVATGIAATAGQAGSRRAGAASDASGLLNAAGRDLEKLIADRGDEIGVLGRAFHQMTGQLAELVGGLEASVNERTRQLATRSRYLEASADIGRVTTSILDPEKLIDQAVEMIRERFDLYYVGMFLADRDGQWAVLRSGTGEAGRILLERQHRLRIEPTSMIGWCIANAQARIAQQAGQDEVRFATPELPETRSEAALPLRARGQVIGALSVQSRQVDVFDSAALAVLQTMADQLAIAIENAQLYVQSQQALQAERRAYTLSTQSEWTDWLRQRSGLTVRNDGRTTEGRAASSAGWYPEMQRAYQAQRVIQSGGRLAIPIQVRGAVIGVINLTKHGGTDSNGLWTNDEINFMESIAEQLGVALDSARLYAETRQRAEQDRLVDEMTSQMRATLDLRSVLETATREMRDALGLAEVEVRLGEGAKDYDRE